jgi:adenosine deaminase
MESDFEPWLRNLPKVELHVHLEGAIPFSLALRLAERNGYPLHPGFRDAWKTDFQFSSFPEFIDHFVQLSSCYRTRDDFAEAVAEFLRNQEAQNIRYCEVFFTPTLHFARKGLPYPELLNGIEEGIRASGTEVEMKLIADISRHSSMELADLTIGFLTQHPSDRVIGLGLGGSEDGFPPELFRAHYDRARELGLNCVAHAGETAGAESVRNAVEILRVRRIGHGVRAREDESVLKLIADRRVPLEICPTSNVSLGIFPSYDAHPLREFWDRGIPVTLNSDDPVFFRSNLQNELRVAHDRFGFTRAELIRLMFNAVEASFATPAMKGILRGEIEDYARETGVDWNSG